MSGRQQRFFGLPALKASRLSSHAAILLLGLNALSGLAQTPVPASPNPSTSALEQGPAGAARFQIDHARVVKRQEIVYLQPPVRNGDYLPLGNGDLGMQVDPFGSQGMGGWINKVDIWLKRHNDPANPLEGYGTLKEWQAAEKKGPEAVQDLLSREETENNHYPSQNVRPRVGGRVASVLLVDGQPLQHVTSPALKEKVTDFEQRLSLYDATVETTFTWPGRSRTRAHALVDSNKNVAVMRFRDTGTNGKQVARRIRLQRYRWERWKGREEFHVRGNRDEEAIVLEYSNVSGLKYAMACTVQGAGVRLVIDPTGETDKPTFRWHSWNGAPSDNYEIVEGNAVFETDPARELDVTVLVALVTSQEATDSTAAALALLRRARQEDLAQREAAHKAWWHAFWARSFVEVADPDAETYWYAQSYLLASSSRAPIAPPICNLWHQFADWPWQGGYWDFNTPAMYTAIHSTNHSELGAPFWRMIQRAMPGFRANARQLYGSRGIFMPSTYGPEGYEIAPAYWRFRYFNTALTGIMQYWRYLYSLDEKLLANEVYPFLKDASLFYEGFLEWDKQKNHYRIPVPSCSLNEAGSAAAWGIRNDALDLAAIRRLYLSAIEASQHLGVDSEERRRWKEVLAGLAPIPSNGKEFTINESGAMEGLVHTNLTTVFPTGAVDRNDPRALATLLAQDRLGMGGQCFTGQMWAASAAWLDRPDVLTRALQRWFKRHLFPNAMVGEHVMEDVAPYGRSYPFILVNESGPWAQAAITEGLCRSLYDGVIRVFSAPPQTADGKPGPARFAGLGATNGFLVASERIVGADNRPRVPFIAIQSLKGATCRVALPGWSDVTVEHLDPRTAEPVGPLQARVAEGVADFATSAGQTYLLYAAGKRPTGPWSEFWERRRPTPRKYVGLPREVTAK